MSIENEAFYTQHEVVPDASLRAFDNQAFADTIFSEIPNASTLVTRFIKDEQTSLDVTHEILANGYLKITQKGTKPNGEPFTNTEIYHKQLSVMPYAASAAGVAITVSYTHLTLPTKRIV